MRKNKSVLLYDNSFAIQSMDENVWVNFYYYIQSSDHNLLYLCMNIHMYNKYIYVQIALYKNTINSCHGRVFSQYTFH